MTGPLFLLFIIFVPNRYYWKISSSNKAEVKGPFAVSERWPALPATIDSAFEEMQTKKMYFFAGEVSFLSLLMGHINQYDYSASTLGLGIEH